jgi:hypothetical protein
VFALFRAVVWIVDRAKQDALARLLLENVTSTSSGEKLDDMLAALAFHPSANDCGCFDSGLGFYNLIHCAVPPPSSEDSAWWDGQGESQNVSQLLTYCGFTKPLILPDRSSERRIRRHGSGGGAVPVDEPVRLARGFPVVIISFVI